MSEWDRVEIVTLAHTITSPFAWQSYCAYATKTHAKTYTCKGNKLFSDIYLSLRRPIGRIRPEAMFFGSQGHVPEDIPKRRKNTPPKSTRRIFWKYSKRFSIWGKRWKTREKFLDTGNTLYGFHSILNLRVKFWSASPNLFSNDS